MCSGFPSIGFMHVLSGMLKNLGWSDEDRPAPKADVAGRAITDPTETKKSHSHRRAVGEAAIIIVMRRLRTGKTGEVQVGQKTTPGQKEQGRMDKENSPGWMGEKKDQNLCSRKRAGDGLKI